MNVYTHGLLISIIYFNFDSITHLRRNIFMVSQNFITHYRFYADTFRCGFASSLLVCQNKPPKVTKLECMYVYVCLEVSI